MDDNSLQSPRSRLLKHAVLLRRFLVMSYHDFYAFRLDFAAGIFQYLLNTIVFIVFWKSVVQYSATSLGTWGFYDLAVLSCIMLIATAITQLFFGFARFSQNVLQGEIDKYLCRPIDPIFALIAEEIHLLPLIQQMFSGIFILWALVNTYGTPPAFGNVVLSVAILAAGCMLIVLIEGCISLLTFWFNNVSNLLHAFSTFRSVERYPLDIFPLPARVSFTLILPVGFVSTIPTSVFLGKTTAGHTYFLLGILLAVFWFILYISLSKAGVKRYESYGG